MIRKLIAGTTVALLLGASAASAITLQFDSSATSSNTPATGASGTATLAFSDVGTNQVQIDVSVENTTGSSTFGAGATVSKLTGFAFSLLSGTSLASISTTGAFLDYAFASGVSLPPFGSFDVAWGDNSNFQAGGPGGALPEGQTDTGLKAIINVGSLYTAATLESAYLASFNDTSDDIGAVMRFQSVNAGSGSDKLLYGGISNPGPGPGPGPNPNPAPVPLPAAGWMLLAAIGGMAFWRRRATA